MRAHERVGCLCGGLCGFECAERWELPKNRRYTVHTGGRHLDADMLSVAPRRAGVVTCCAALVAFGLLLLQPQPAPRIVDPVSFVIVKAIEIPIGVVAAKLTNGLLSDVLLHTLLNDTSTCYEEFSCGKACRHGYGAVEGGTRGYDLCWQRCCPERPSSCYKSDKWNITCHDGYRAVEDGYYGRTCCPVEGPRCFKSTRCFTGCPAGFVSVEGGVLNRCEDLCCPEDTCFVGTQCFSECPARYLPIPINRSALTVEERLGLSLGDPFSCVDLCCPRAHGQTHALRTRLDEEMARRVVGVAASQASAVAEAAVHQAAQAAAAAAIDSTSAAMEAVG